MSNLSDFSKYIHYNDTNLHSTVLVAFLCPFVWNILARLCNKITANQSRSVQYTTCYLLAAWIFCFSSYRDYLFSTMLTTQPKYPVFIQYSDILNIVGPLLIATGQLFVITSLYQLGITGTFLGDYCGILMSHRVTAFPFNVLNDPMYVGATLSFLGYSLYSYSLTGILVTVWIGILYTIALQFEGPYTTWIYEEAERKKNKIL